MKTFDVCGVKVSADFEDFDFYDAVDYVDYVFKHTDYTEQLEWLKVKMCDDGKVDVEYQFRGEDFERIRRITGYLVGTTNRWNDSKRAELRDRVKHI